MQEKFLHFIWQHQYFDKSELTTSNGDRVHILATGTLNTDGGPDFINAKLKIGEVTWVGNIEIHLKASDWYTHKHQKDNAYDNVVLHVVWNDDKTALRADGSSIPTIELQNKIQSSYQERYAQLLKNNISSIPCQQHLTSTNSILKFSMLDKALMQRLQRKASEVSQLLQLNKGNWEETTYQLLCKNFGFKLNSEPFLRLSHALPYKIIQKHHHSLLQTEALLFGQAGILERTFTDEYSKTLQKEYDYLAHKYQLRPNQIHASEWKFLRLRPANFPTLRMAQLASILSATDNIFAIVEETESPDSIFKFLKQKTSEYWHKHYTFEKSGSRTTESIGIESLCNITINTIAPLLTALAKEKDKEEYLERAIQLLETLPAESNRIIKNWQLAGFEFKNAADSQGGIELFNNFCKNKLCLNCSIGAAIIKNG